MPLRRPFLLLALALLAAPQAAHVRAADGGSLESFLEELRKKRDAELERLRPAVDATAKRFGTARSPAELKKLQQELEALGPETALLLLPYLDPGAQGGAAEEQTAREVTLFLERTHPAGLVDELVRLARAASPKGRANALRALGSAPEQSRALAGLRGLYGELAGALRGECVRALARQAPFDGQLVAALADTHPAVLAAALEALREEPRRAPRAEVLTVLADPSRGAAVLVELMRYLTQAGQSLDEDSAVRLLAFAARSDLPVEARLAVLDGFPRLGVTMGAPIRRAFEPVVASPDSAVKDAALIALSLLKDSKARRDLLKFYDEQVKDNPNWALAYQKRGKILLRIREYGPAAKDFGRALELQEDTARLPANRELWVDLARAYVLDDKLQKAAEVLQDFGLTTDLRRELREDPDFRALAEHSRHGKVLE